MMPKTLAFGRCEDCNGIPARGIVECFNCNRKICLRCWYHKHAPKPLTADITHLLAVDPMGRYGCSQAASPQVQES